MPSKSVIRMIEEALRALRLYEPRGAAQKHAFGYVERSPEHDVMYTFPSVDRGSIRPQREAFVEGLVGPTLQASLHTGSAVDPVRMQRVAETLRIAQKAVDKNLPKQKFMPVQADVLARPEAHEALSAFRGPNSTGIGSTGFLDYLVAAPSSKGAGERLLKGALSDPRFMPDMHRLYFTPLQGARQFYRDKFGAEFASPSEALSDVQLRYILDNLGEGQNAEDLGVGVIRRKTGGLAR